MRDIGHTCASPHAYGIGIDWHVPPTHGLNTVFAGTGFKRCLTKFSELFILGQEAHRDRVVGRSGQLNTDLVGDLDHEFVWHLHQDARTVAGFRVATARAAMPEVTENFQAL